MDRLTKAQLFTLTRLERVINNTMDTDDKGWGLCAYASLSALGVCMPDAFEQWEHFSGSYPYPVPSPEGAGYAYKEAFNMYDRSTEYGRLRIELAIYLYNTFCKIWNVTPKEET